MAPVESARTVIPEPRPVIAIGRRYYNANHWRRRNVEDRARRRCVIVSRCGSSVRLNYLGAGNQAQSRSKPESEHRQCHHHKSLSRDRISLLLFGRLNPTITGKLPKNRQSAAKYLPRRDAKNAESIRSFAQIGSSKRLWRNPCKICVTCGATARDCKCFDPVSDAIRLRVGYHVAGPVVAYGSTQIRQCCSHLPATCPHRPELAFKTAGSAVAQRH